MSPPITYPIAYPIIFRFDDMTVPSDEEFPKVWNWRHLSGNTFETPETIHPEARFHWLIDATGHLREMTILSKHREWARPLRFIWPFVRVRYTLGEGKPITIGTLRHLIEGTRLDEDKSLTPALNRFLAPLPDHLPLTPELFSQFMAGGGDEDEDEEN